MSGRGWHMVEEGGAVTLCRHLPPRFDVMAEGQLPEGSATRYAHQIRQDMWRALQSVRGFSPVVRLTPSTGGWRVEAGGRVARPAPGITDQIATLLADPALRIRWITHAQRRRR